MEKASVEEEKEYLMSGEASGFLGVSKSTLIRWHRIGKLIPVKVHVLTGIRMYSKKDLQAFLDDKSNHKGR